MAAAIFKRAVTMSWNSHHPEAEPRLQTL